MEDYGFIRVAAAIPELRVADCDFNVQQIKNQIFAANEEQVQIIVFPELSVTAYTCGDLFLQKTLINEAERAVIRLLQETQELSTGFIIGAPVEHQSKVYNCALVCNKGKIMGIVPKIHLPNYSESSEKRWFESYAEDVPTVEVHYAGNLTAFGTKLLFGEKDRQFAVEIGEDVCAPIPPGSYHAIAGAQIIFNLSANPELLGKEQYVKSLISQQSVRCRAAYVYASAGFGESTTDLAYTGNAAIYENGTLLAESKRFQFREQMIVGEVDFELLNAERKRNAAFFSKSLGLSYRLIAMNLFGDEKKNLKRTINPAPFIPATVDNNTACEEIFSIQAAGLAKRLTHINCKTLVLGVSGGLDSTLALLVCVKTIDKLGLPRKMICGVTMPGFGTTDRTCRNAVQLMQSLGVTIKEINIKAACEQHFKDIQHDLAVHDVTYENAQARERTQILMDLANQMNGIVVGTGDLSELALGWTTYNGDQMSMYGVNAGVPKTVVQQLIRWAAETQIGEKSRTVLFDILNTPVSPELLPVDNQGQTTQFTENMIGFYELHDFFLYYTLRYGFSPSKIYYLARYAFNGIYEDSTLLKWMEVFFSRFFHNQFKRSCMPDGIKVGSISLSPRGDWQMPSDASVALWIKEIRRLKIS